MPFNILRVICVKLFGAYHPPSRGLVVIMIRFHTGLRIIFVCLVWGSIIPLFPFSVPFLWCKSSPYYTLKVQIGSGIQCLASIFPLGLLCSSLSEFFAHCASKPGGPILYLAPSRRAVLWQWYAQILLYHTDYCVCLVFCLHDSFSVLVYLH